MVPLAPIAASLLFGATPSVDDWPQWRGPERTGVSPEADWHPVGRGGLLWEAALGVGHSSFAVARGTVYALGHDVEREADQLWALDLQTGEIRWRSEWPGERLDNSHEGGTLTTPTVVGERVFVTSRHGRVAAYDAGTGSLQWSVDLATELGVAQPSWGFAASPVVVGERVFVSLGRTAALAVDTGKVLWSTEALRGSAYSTPAVFEQGGATRLAVLTGEGLAITDASDGGELAFHRWDDAPRVAPMTPVVSGERIVIAGAYGRGARALRFTGATLDVEWSSRAMRNKMSGCVLWNGHLYGFDESILECMALDGTVLWRQRGLGTGSLSVAGGRLVILDGRGQLVIALATPLAYTELSRRPLLDDGTFWSTPVLSGGRVLCRNSLGRMVCVDHRGGPDRATVDGRAANQRLAAALLDADAIFARHAAATAGPSPSAIDAPPLTSLRMTGRVQSLRNTEREGPVELTWIRTGGFRWREEPNSVPGALDIGHNASVGWTVGRHLDTRALEGEALSALREAGDLERWLDPKPFYPRRATLGVSLFDHRSCYVVAGTTSQGHARKLYFEVDSGLLAGHEGTATDLWTYGDYRPIGGRLIPTTWSFFDADTGEMTTASFEASAAEANPALPPIEPPASALPFLRSEVEIQAANAQLARQHADLVGEWWPDAATLEARPKDRGVRRFWIERGFLATDRPQEGGNYWRPAVTPDGASANGSPAEGHFQLIGAGYLTFTVERSAEGAATAIQVFVDRQPRTRLVRRSSVPPNDQGK